ESAQRPKETSFPAPNSHTLSPETEEKAKVPFNLAGPFRSTVLQTPSAREAWPATADQEQAPEACERAGGRLRRPNIRLPLLASHSPWLHSLSRWSLTGVGSAAGHFPQQESQTSRKSEGEAGLRIRSRSLSKLEAEPRGTTGRRSPSIQSTTSGPPAPATLSSSPRLPVGETGTRGSSPQRSPETWGGVSSAPARRLGGGARRAGPGAPEKLALEFELEWLPQCPLPGLWASDPDRRRPQGRARGCESVDSSLGGLSRSSTVASLDTDSTKSSGQSNNTSDTCAEFRIKYVGAIEKLKFSEGKSLEGPLDLINYIDVAQQDGKLPFVPLEEEFIMGVSKYGIKVSTSDQYDVLHRHALYLIIRMVCYDDGLGAGRSLLALKTTDASNEEYSLWVYQCHSLEQAQAICKVLSTAFDSVLTSEKS
uniref:Integrin beta-1-binding protein 1 n=1 Tax=Lynx canadensis TaxID=61383 RepID=A0A667GCT6_LYNCA